MERVELIEEVEENFFFQLGVGNSQMVVRRKSGDDVRTLPCQGLIYSTEVVLGNLLVI